MLTYVCLCLATHVFKWLRQDMKVMSVDLPGSFVHQL